MPHSQTSLGSRIELAIRSACRRRVFVLAMEQLAAALSPILAGAILILLIGTDILNSWWLFGLGFGGLAFAAVRMRGRQISSYRVAQIVDHRLRLNDSLSTAFFLLSSKDDTTNPIARFQIEHASRVAECVRISQAFPLRGGRAWALTGALAAVAFGLFTVRYLVTNSLSLKAALVPLHFGAVFESSVASENRRMPDPPADSKSGDERLNDTAKAGREQRDFLGANPNRAGQAQSRSNEQDLQIKSDPGSAAQRNSNDDKAGDKSMRASAGPSQPEQANSAEGQSATGQQSSSGLLDKMKDALSSLLSKMHANQNQQRSSQSGEQGQGDSTSGNPASQSKEHGQQDARDARANHDQSSKAEAQGQATEKAQASSGRSSGQSPQDGSDAHSGIGRQDGDKELKEAEQLKAMGKLAEIIGKRSADLTGEIAVETASGKQQLKTAYSQRIGQHADLGGEITRDEIPIQDQQYIREYMELVRKQPKNQP